MKKIEYFFDILSPYSYLSWNWVRENINKLKEKEIVIEFIPVTLATIITHYKTLGPAQIGPKRNYLFRDLLRYCKIHNIPFTTPKDLPFNSLYGLRLSLKEVSGDFQFQVIDELFQLAWARGLDAGNSDVIVEELAKKNLPIEEMMEKISSREVREKLKKNVEYALSKGVFGVPSFHVDDELFWGNDSIKYLEMHLKNEDPLDQEKYQMILKKHNFTDLERLS